MTGFSTSPPRAWHKKKKKMYDVRALTWWNCTDESLYVQVTIQGTPMGAKIDLDEVDLLMPTGLHDKNGKEIYGGDVVKWAQFKLPVSINSHHGYRFMAGEDQLCREYALNGEIIGNIYENPELKENP